MHKCEKFFILNMYLLKRMASRRKTKSRKIEFTTRHGERVSFRVKPKRKSRRVLSPKQKAWQKCIKETMKETDKIGPALFRAAKKRYNSRSRSSRK